MNLQELRDREYAARLAATALRREVYAQPTADPALLRALDDREVELSDLEKKVAAEEAAEKAADEKAAAEAATGDPDNPFLGADTTGLSVDVMVRLAQVPTAVYHLFDRRTQPLLSCEVTNHFAHTRRLRVTSFIDGYSARAVDTVELEDGKSVTIEQLPTLFLDRVRTVTELTAATVNVLVEDLDDGKVEIHRTEPVRLLARTAAPLAVRDPSSKKWQYLTKYFGAFVTPNAPEIMRFLRDVADLHPDRQLSGYFAADVTPQVKAVYDALANVGITYVHSIVAFSPEDGVAANQRVRLPRESLADRQANCIDATVLMATVLEALSMSPAIVTVPQHAFLGWETAAPGSKTNTWRYVETTVIGTKSFEDACSIGEDKAARGMALLERTGDETKFKRWALRELRTQHGIYPME